MPFPKNGTERARPDLAGSLFEYDLIMNMNQMVAFDVFPLREVQVFKGTFGRVKAKEMLRRHPNASLMPPGEAFARAPRAAYPEDDTRFEEDTYRTQEYGLEGRVDENEAEAYRDYFEQESFVSQHINNQLMTETEVRVSTACFDTTIFTGSKTYDVGGAVGNEEWNAPGTATPIKHFQNAMFGVYANSGLWPDACVMNRKAWLYLIETDEIRDRVHSQGAGSPDRASLITRQIVGQILQIPTIIVAGGTHDTNAPNGAFAPDQIWGPHCMVFKQARGRDMREVALGRSFHWAEDDSMPNGYVEDYYDPTHRATKIRVRHQMQNKLIYPEVGFLLQDVYV